MDDPRIELLNQGIMSQLEFMRLTTANDPWRIARGKMVYKDKRETEKAKHAHRQARLHTIKTNGGLNGKLMLQHKDILLKVYPELKNTYAKVEDEISEANCKGCQANRRAGVIVSELMEIKYDGRDLSSLQELFPHYTISKLKGEEIDYDSIKINLPPNLIVNDIPIKKDESAADDIDPQEYVQNSAGIIRKYCIDCVRKHIPHAIVLFQEALQGYSKEEGYEHEAFALVHISEAIDEIVEKDPETAQKLTQIKEDYVEGNKTVLDTVGSLVQVFRNTYKDNLRDFNKNTMFTLGYLSAAADSLVINNQLEEAKEVRKIRLKLVGQTKKKEV